ncbi:hypothetical protein ACI6Q2_14490 [Chitinophagaceae bacterium LWZ2-11]
MNRFTDIFGEKINDFWELPTDEQKVKICSEILQYANNDSQSFKNDLKAIQFDNDLYALPIVMEALSQDTDNWGQFYVELLDTIFNTAKFADKPYDVLTYLMEFAYIEKINKPFVKQIADKLYNELNTQNTAIQIAALWTLPAYLKNEAVTNKHIIKDALEDKLNDNNWRIRYVAFKSLEYENLLPKGRKLALKDKLCALILGAPKIV